MDASSGQPGVTNPIPPRTAGNGASEVRPLIDDVIPGTALHESKRAIRDELAQSYSMERWYEELRALDEGSPTYFDALDDLGLRWLPGKVYAVIARPGGGKTGFLLESAVRYLEQNPHKTALVLSWEEPLTEIISRLLLRYDAKLTRKGASFGDPVIWRNSVRNYGRGKSTPHEITPRLDDARGELERILPRLKLIDGDAVGRDAVIVLHEVAEWMRTDGAPPIGLVAVDYFQKLRASGFHANRQSELQTVSDLLRRFAKGATFSGDADVHDSAYAVPVLIGAQVTREADELEHPTGSRIRESDDLLNDAAGVIALSWEKHNTVASDDELRSLRVSVPKNRDGRTVTDEVARLPWHPARYWLAPEFLRDGGKVRWSSVKNASTNGYAVHD